MSETIIIDVEGGNAFERAKQRLNEQTADIDPEDVASVYAIVEIEAEAVVDDIVSQEQVETDPQRHPLLEDYWLAVDLYRLLGPALGEADATKRDTDQSPLAREYNHVVESKNSLRDEVHNETDWTLPEYRDEFDAPAWDHDIITPEEMIEAFRRDPGDQIFIPEGYDIPSQWDEGSEKAEEAARLEHLLDVSDVGKEDVERHDEPGRVNKGSQQHQVLSIISLEAAKDNPIASDELHELIGDTTQSSISASLTKLYQRRLVNRKKTDVDTGGHKFLYWCTAAGRAELAKKGSYND